MFKHLLAAALCAACLPATAAKCLPYEPAQVDLQGIVKRKTFPGPPNYESVKSGDAAETGFYLVLQKPVCTVDTHNTEEGGSLDKVTLVQLVLNQTQYALLRPKLGQMVGVRGGLFGASSPHHHAELLMMVKQIDLKL